MLQENPFITYFLVGCRVGIYPIFAYSAEDPTLEPKSRAVTPESQKDSDNPLGKPDVKAKEEESETRRISQALASVGPHFVWEPTLNDSVHEGHRMTLLLRLEDGMNRKLEIPAFAHDSPELWVRDLLQHKLISPVSLLKSLSD